MYATTRYNFVRLKATHKISPLEESISLTGDKIRIHQNKLVTDLFYDFVSILLV
jgi:hypothetical protein